MSFLHSFLARPWAVIAASILLRAGLLLYGRWQDANSAVKYTDIDYLVFTDASRFIAQGRSPYDRATYRYTPLLAWLLYPTSWGGIWFEWGKALFAAGDVVTGWLIFLILRGQKLGDERGMKYASIWLLNPMVANISTRGSSEGLLAVIVIALLWAAVQQRIALAGALLGLGVHFKIYPFIYAASIFWWLDNYVPTGEQGGGELARLFSRKRITLGLSSLATFMALNVAMFAMYVYREQLIAGPGAEAKVGTASRSSNIATHITSLASTTGTISPSITPFSISAPCSPAPLACELSRLPSSRR